MSKVLGQNNLFNSLNIKNYHFLALLTPINDFLIFLNINKITSIMSHNLQTNSESDCFLSIFYSIRGLF